MLRRLLKALVGPSTPARADAKRENLDSSGVTLSAGALLKRFAEMDPKQQLKVLEGIHLIEPLGLPHTEARFSVTSKQERNRARTVKETWTAEWVSSLPAGSVLWDIGANIGVFTILAALNEGVRNVVAIEPSSVNVASLTRNVRLNEVNRKVVVVGGGVGAETGIFPLRLSTVDPGGALHSFGSMLELPGKGVATEVLTELCFLWRMDDLAALRGIPFPTHLKIDVDGYERELLAGAAKLLKDERLRAIQIEVFQPTDDRALEQAVISVITDSGLTLSERLSHGEGSPTTDLRFERRSG